ncbi:hypothetical protein CS063_01080 [Sporanaerobium hydrogeniformans]|uniref:Uncharacterized protein n=1 Tax=Sporanaerobium hydrogeniformans TaxID=3072179 RepID=A0AC61DGS3_9FIRM|nr:DUF58 domain-containing protein [Sporanaerobium hydrogeniformans]PHV72102.1 hypothetical protein CS063_01080 [Sporanaerobium hydrogeniformans]
MVRNRILLSISLILSVIFVSFYGGTTAYLLFYSLVILPVIAWGYTAYVYLRLHFYQEVGQRKVVKGELVPYYFKLVNKDYLTYSHIKLYFHQEFSTIQADALETVYCLLPGDEIKRETMLCCKYRGEYAVGVKSIEITDFLYLFRVNYPVMWGPKLTVLPKVCELEQLMLTTLDEDPKTLSYHMGGREGFLESDVKKYTGGEPRKFIHWKASAKKGEILVRQYTEPMELSQYLLMDLRRLEGEVFEQVVREDCLLTGALSLGWYYQNRHIQYEIVYEQNGIKECTIHNEKDFWQFYKRTTDFKFYSDLSIGTLLKRIRTSQSFNDVYVLTSLLDAELGCAVLEQIKKGNKVTILLIIPHLDEKVYALKEELENQGIKTYIIHHQEHLYEILKRGEEGRCSKKEVLFSMS